MEEGNLLVLAAQNNTTEWNTLKFAEELFECGEALIKYSTKKGSNRPSVETIAKEFADVMLRGSMFFQKEAILRESDIMDLIDEHIEKKRTRNYKKISNKT